MEFMADMWGRAIRYGGPPEATNQAQLERRLEAVSQMKRISQLEAALEEKENRLHHPSRAWFEGLVARAKTKRMADEDIARAKTLAPLAAQVAAQSVELATAWQRVSDLVGVDSDS